MNNFRVHFTKTVTAEVIIEADSYEEAVQLASSKKPDMSPDWVGTEEHLQKTEEYEYEVMGPCGRCKTPIVNRSIPGKPYTYGSGDHDIVCYDCIGDDPQP